MLPLRLVIDTNVIVSAALEPAGLHRTVLLPAITKPSRWYVSRPILEEYSEVLARPELKIRKKSEAFSEILEENQNHNHTKQDLETAVQYLPRPRQQGLSLGGSMAPAYSG
jgi:predicted nucleic acid-binding protein